MKEETGIEVTVSSVIGIYSNPRHVIEYTNGEVRQEFSILFRAHPTGGNERTSSESSEVIWVESERIDGLNMHPSIRLRVNHGFAQGNSTYYT